MYATLCHAVGIHWAMSVGYGVHWCSPAGERLHFAPIAGDPVDAMSSTRSISLHLQSPMFSSLFLACSIRTPRNDTVRLDTEMNTRSPKDSAASLQLDGAAIPITQLPSGSQFSEWLGRTMQKQVGLPAPRSRRCDDRTEGTVAHVRPLILFPAMITETCTCDLVASLPHRQVPLVRGGFNSLHPLFV